ncbi:hypothetical protein ASZ90_014987 [hydrocarbon metagenome]|uniref:Uncharacterized protein n=1 Tax=hydrocarbon metagenome TaxID=938273 RepID=A0A0W8F376_9ZZZZ
MEVVLREILSTVCLPVGIHTVPTAVVSPGTPCSADKGSLIVSG